MNKILAIAALSLVGACASAGTYVAPTNAQHFQEGVTTYQDIVRVHGLPQTDVNLPDGTRQVTYVYSKTSLNAATFVPVVGLFAGGANTQTNTLTITFDQSGRYVRTASGATQTNVRNGF